MCATSYRVGVKFDLLELKFQAIAGQGTAAAMYHVIRAQQSKLNLLLNSIS